MLSPHEHTSSRHATTTENLDTGPLQRVPGAISVFQPYRSEVAGNQWLGSKEGHTEGSLLPGREGPHGTYHKSKSLKSPSENLLKVSRNFSNYVVLRIKVTETGPLPGSEEHSDSLALQLRSSGGMHLRTDINQS